MKHLYWMESIRYKDGLSKQEFMALSVEARIQYIERGNPMPLGVSGDAWMRVVERDESL